MTKILLIVITSILALIFTGCAGSTPEVLFNNSQVKIGSSEVSDAEKNKVMQEQLSLDRNGVYSENIKYNYVHHARGTKRNKSDRAFMKAKFKIVNDVLIVKDISNCGYLSCGYLKRSFSPRFAKFYGTVDSKKAYIQRTLSTYLNTDPETMKVINAWINDIPNIKLGINMNADFPVNKELLRTFESKVPFKPSAYNARDIYQDFKRGNNKDINKYLNTLTLGSFYHYPNMNHGRYLFHRNTRVGDFTTYVYEKNYKSLDFPLLTKGDIKFDYLPKTYTASNSDISITLTKNGNSYYAIITNNTSSFIDAKSLSIYFGEDVKTMALDKKLAPHSKTLKGQIRFKVSFEAYKLLGKNIEFGTAVEYVKDGRKGNLYKAENFNEAKLRNK